MTQFFDLSHPIEHGMVTYKGLPGPLIEDFMGREDSHAHYTGGTTFQIGRINMVANTGTYVDSPFHRYEDGKDIASLDLASLANLQGRLFHADAHKRAIGAELFEGQSLAGTAVLVHTGWDRHWRTETYSCNSPFLTKDAATFLVEAGVFLVGIDSINIDDPDNGQRPVHSILLRAGIPVVEHLCSLSSLPEDDFRFFAVPAPVKGFGTFPIRAFATSSK